VQQKLDVCVCAVIGLRLSGWVGAVEVGPSSGQYPQCIQMQLLFKLLVVVAAAAVAIVEGRHVLKESMNHREDFILHSRADANATHEVTFAVKQLNLDKLEEMVLRRATPGSSQYQQWMTFDEVGALITNHAGFDATMKWLKGNKDVQVNPFSVWIVTYSNLCCYVD
jgi:hypothetical protein